MAGFGIIGAEEHSQYMAMCSFCNLECLLAWLLVSVLYALWWHAPFVAMPGGTFELGKDSLPKGGANDDDLDAKIAVPCLYKCFHACTASTFYLQHVIVIKPQAAQAEIMALQAEIGNAHGEDNRPQVGGGACT